MRTRRGWTSTWALGAILVLALGLRVYRLDHQSLWYDEGVSAYLTTLSLPALTTWTATDIQPPLYYYLLKGWTALAGRSEALLRWPSVFFDVLTVAVAWRAGRRLFSPRGGIAAALLFALSPLTIYYAQEARNYALLAFLVLLSSLLAFELMSEAQGARRRRLWPAYVVVTAAALYTHYFAWFVVLFHALFAGSLWVWERRPLRGLLRPLSAWAAAGLLYLPWLPSLITRYHVDESYWQGTLKVGEALRKVLISFALGETVLEGQALPAALGVWALFGLCLLALLAAGRRERRSALFLLLFLVVPVAGVILVALRAPKFNPRYLMPAAPALLLGLAGGLDIAWRKLTPVRSRALKSAGALALLAACGFVLGNFLRADYNLYFDPAFTKPDFRGAARYLAEHRAPDEGIILVSGHMFPVFDYYLPDADRLLLPPDRILSTQHVLDENVRADLARYLAGRPGAWVVRWQDEVVDPNGWVGIYLERAGEPLPVEESFWHIELDHYRLADGEFPAGPPIDHPVGANFGGKIELVGWSQPALDSYLLFWRANTPMTEDLQISLRLVDGQGLVWGQEDRRPAAYLHPTMRWEVGAIQPGRGTLPAMPGTPPGTYFLEIRAYSATHAEDLDVLDQAGAPQGQAVTLGPWNVERAGAVPPGDALQVDQPLDLAWEDGILLHGARPLPAELSVGESLTVELAWQCVQEGAGDLQGFVELTPAEEPHRILRHPLQLMTQYSTRQWRAGEWWWSRDLIRVPADWPSGTTHISLVVEKDGQVIGREVVLGAVDVRAPARLFTLPADVAITYPTQAVAGGFARLLGLISEPPAPTAGEPASLTLVWQALAEEHQSYVAFVHLLNAEGRVVAQVDHVPAGGERPTTGWVAGEYILDAYHFDTWPADVSAVEIGIYAEERGLFRRVQWAGPAGEDMGESLRVPYPWPLSVGTLFGEVLTPCHRASASFSGETAPVGGSGSHPPPMSPRTVWSAGARYAGSPRRE